ncbi:hypothetical protein YC2023_086827 [Brassica napus]
MQRRIGFLLFLATHSSVDWGSCKIAKVFVRSHFSASSSSAVPRLRCGVSRVHIVLALVNEPISVDLDKFADGIIQPPEDIATKTIVEKTASFLSRNKMDKSEIMPSDVRYNFLRSKTDPSHAYYSYMLSKYSDAHSQGGGGAVEGAAVNIEPDDHTKDLTIINTPAQVPAITLAARVACLVSVEGLDLEKQLRDSQVSDTRFNFLRDASDVCHAYYQRSLAYLSFGNKSQLKARAQPPPVFNTPNTQILSLPNFLQFRLPQGMTLKQLDTIKVTAQFSLWYGHYFVWALKGNVTQLEFLSPKHSWHPFYNEFQRAYERLFKPPKDTKEQLYKSAEYTDAIQKGFLQRIQLDDPIKERKWLEQGERAMIDWHDATSKPFAMKEVQELLPPQGPDPKRQKLEVSLLVPETQFLAQHQGLSSLTVSFPNRQAVVIKVSSLSANVASLKQIIAEVIQIPADKHKLSGKSGVLKDDNMTLAHYNVRDGDILTLSL